MATHCSIFAWESPWAEEGAGPSGDVSGRNKRKHRKARGLSRGEDGDGSSVPGRLVGPPSRAPVRI